MAEFSFLSEHSNTLRPMLNLLLVEMLNAPILNNEVSKWQSSLSLSYLSSFRNGFVYVNEILLYNNEENIALIQ